MPLRPLTKEEKEMIWIAVGMRENYIETGDISYDAATVSKIGEKHLPPGVGVKALSTEQMQLLIDSRNFKTKVLTDKLYIEE